MKFHLKISRIAKLVLPIFTSIIFVFIINQAHAKSLKKGEIYSSWDGKQVIEVISKNELEFKINEDIILANYNYKNGKVRVVYTVFGTKNVAYYEIVKEGLRDKKGKILYTKSAKLKAQEEAKAAQEEAKAAKIKALESARYYAKKIGIPERPLNYVVDLAGIVDDPTENRLNGYLLQLEQKTTAQLVILTIKRLEGNSIEDFSSIIAHDKWKLGQKGKDNGVLFLISVKDRKYRIEVGYGLENVLPDSLVGSMGRNILVPFFRMGDYSKGIFDTTLAMANKIATDSGVKIEEMPIIK